MTQRSLRTTTLLGFVAITIALLAILTTTANAQATITAVANTTCTGTGCGQPKPCSAGSNCANPINNYNYYCVDHARKRVDTCASLYADFSQLPCTSSRYFNNMYDGLFPAKPTIPEPDGSLPPTPCNNLPLPENPGGGNTTAPGGLEPSCDKVGFKAIEVLCVDYQYRPSFSYNTLVDQHMYQVPLMLCESLPDQSAMSFKYDYVMMRDPVSKFPTLTAVYWKLCEYLTPPVYIWSAETSQDMPPEDCTDRTCANPFGFKPALGYTCQQIINSTNPYEKDYLVDAPQSCCDPKTRPPVGQPVKCNETQEERYFAINWFNEQNCDIFQELCVIDVFGKEQQVPCDEVTCQDLLDLPNDTGNDVVVECGRDYTIRSYCFAFDQFDTKKQFDVFLAHPSFCQNPTQAKCVLDQINNYQATGNVLNLKDAIYLLSQNSTDIDLVVNPTLPNKANYSQAVYNVSCPCLYDFMCTTSGPFANNLGGYLEQDVDYLFDIIGLYNESAALNLIADPQHPEMLIQPPTNAYISPMNRGEWYANYYFDTPVVARINTALGQRCLPQCAQVADPTTGRMMPLPASCGFKTCEDAYQHRQCFCSEQPINSLNTPAGYLYKPTTASHCQAVFDSLVKVDVRNDLRLPQLFESFVKERHVVTKNVNNPELCDAFIKPTNGTTCDPRPPKPCNDTVVVKSCEKKSCNTVLLNDIKAEQLIVDVNYKDNLAVTARPGGQGGSGNGHGNGSGHGSGNNSNGNGSGHGSSGNTGKPHHDHPTDFNLFIAAVAGAAGGLRVGNAQLGAGGAVGGGVGAQAGPGGVAIGAGAGVVGGIIGGISRLPIGKPLQKDPL